MKPCATCKSPSACKKAGSCLKGSKSPKKTYK